MDGKEGTDEFNEILTLFADMESSRFLYARDPIPQSDGVRNLLHQFPDNTFKQIVRCRKTNFARIVEYIKYFLTTLLFLVEIQGMVVLNRLGCDRNGASVGALGRMFGISTGSVHNFTNRVFRALYNLRDQIIFWPNAGSFSYLLSIVLYLLCLVFTTDQRRDISHRFATNHGLPGAVGIIDGTPVNFAQRSGIDGEVWFSRKQRYSMNLQLICDDRGSITYYIVG